MYLAALSSRIVLISLCISPSFFDIHTADYQSGVTGPFKAANQAKFHNLYTATLVRFPASLSRTLASFIWERDQRSLSPRCARVYVHLQSGRSR